MGRCSNDIAAYRRISRRFAYTCPKNLNTTWSKTDFCDHPRKRDYSGGLLRRARPWEVCPSAVCLLLCCCVAIIIPSTVGIGGMLCDLEAWSETIGLGFLPISPTVPTPTAAGDAKHPQRGRAGDPDVCAVGAWRHHCGRVGTVGEIGKKPNPIVSDQASR